MEGSRCRSSPTKSTCTCTAWASMLGVGYSTGIAATCVLVNIERASLAVRAQ
ncbi:hypothetical protein [Nostocoides sp. F2B08]|uniref:hypothetical protein n=1 Tax=Nostocoides sp. F2B08 TaxID=2653936 RepID=UPI00186B1217|nr:hypothetical protein [Tetrasphaera sp. F2B08]